MYLIYFLCSRRRNKVNIIVTTSKTFYLNTESTHKIHSFKKNILTYSYKGNHFHLIHIKYLNNNYNKIIC